MKTDENTRTPQTFQWPRELRKSSHCWHVLGGTATRLYMECPACNLTMVIECPHEDDRLRYVLMNGTNVVGIGRGFLLGDCEADYRDIELDGYPFHGCSLAQGEYGLISEGVCAWPAELPTESQLEKQPGEGERR